MWNKSINRLIKQIIMNDIEVLEVTPTTVTFKTDAGSITLCGSKPRVMTRVGFTTPVEQRQAIKKYFAIMRDQKNNN